MEQYQQRRQNRHYQHAWSRTRRSERETGNLGYLPMEAKKVALCPLGRPYRGCSDL